MDPLVSQEWLREHLADPGMRVVDCRYVLGAPGAGREAFLAGHIAGAAFLDLDTDLADPVVDGRNGRHPLPSRERFQAAARRAGISGDSIVVAYDEHMTGGAARLWWLLRHFGHEAVAVLEGGFDAWTGGVVDGEEVVAGGTFVARLRSDDAVDVADVAARLKFPDRVLVDARASERFRGDVEPIDPVPGRIPGARNVPYMEDLPGDLVAADEEIVVYCGSGVTASVVLLRLAAAGRDDAKLYAGSYSEWVNRELPVERG
jgi:thiosulfate/3-mercaptopyruvate sulfurtransferase